MRTVSEHPGVAGSLQLELELRELRAEATSGDVSVMIDAGTARVTLSLSGDAAIALANQLTDAVDELDSSDQS